jgi:hypothetical protein
MALIVSVLKSGGVYTAEYVERLKDSLPGYDFVCFSDVPVPCDRIPLKHNLPNWWSKLEIFTLKEKCFYLDLDTVVDGDISEIVNYPHKFTMLSDFYHGTPASGIMAWEGDYSNILTDYDPRKIYPGHGDQGYIATKVVPEYFQDLFPGRIDSYKVGKYPLANIVCYHGSPKPHETGWAKKRS